MSPEQAKLNERDIDTRSDIYSLGVVLYELLTGETPFDRGRLQSAAFEEMLRIIRDEDPPKPSVRLSSSQSLPAIAANRHVDPKRLNTQVRGELDWIVMKALEKDRGRRYETANAFADDVARYLNNDSVTACPPTIRYRFRMFVRRNKALLATATAIAVTIKHLAPVTSVFIKRSTAGFVGVSASLDGVVQTWALPSGELLEKCEVPLAENPARKVTCSVTGDILIFHGDHEALVWDVEGCVIHSKLDLGSRLNVAVSPDSKWVACDESFRLSLWQLGRAESFRVPVPISWDRCFSLAFSPDGSLLAGGGDSGRPFISLWDTRDWQQIGRITHGSIVLGIAISPDGRWLASTGTDHSVKIWDLRDLRRRELLTIHDWIRPLTISPNGKIVATSGHDCSVLLWEMDTGRTHDLMGHDDRVTDAAFSGDGKTLASASVDGLVKLWDVETNACTATLQGHSGTVYSVAFSSRDGTQLVSSGGFGEVLVWDVPSGKWTPCKGHREKSTVCRVRVSPDYRFLVSGTIWSKGLREHSDGPPEEAIVWDITGPEPEMVKKPIPCSGIKSVGFSPDSRYFALGCNNEKVRIRRLDSLDELSTLSGDGRWMNGVSFSPKGERIVTVGTSGEIRIFRNWHRAQKKGDVTVVRLSEPLRHVEFFRNRNAFVTASMDGRLRVWRVETEKP